MEFADQLAVGLSADLGADCSQDWVWDSLRQLSRAGLLQNSIQRHPASMPTSRRQFANQLGKLAILAPVIISVTAPLSAQLLSCTDSCTGKPDCTPCKSGSSGKCDKYCCNGNCIGSTAVCTHCDC